MRINWITSKTVIGAIIAAIGHLIAVAPDAEKETLIAIGHAIEGIGFVFTAYGARHAIAKASQGVAQLAPITVVLSLLLALVPAPSLSLEVDEWFPNFQGDSLKYVIRWKQAPDSATLGKIDSTRYRFVASKGVTFYGSTGLTTPNVAVTRRFGAGRFADSLKLAKPAVGDSVTFQITNFVQVRDGDASVAGSAGWKYRRSAAPPPATPTIDIVEF